MGYKTEKTNFRVVVEPRHPGDFGFASISGITQSERDWIRDCEEIVSQIKRHVDGISSASCEYDCDLVCEYCGSQWTEGENSTHNGGCCHKDCEIYEKESAE